MSRAAYCLTGGPATGCVCNSLAQVQFPGNAILARNKPHWRGAAAIRSVAEHRQRAKPGGRKQLYGQHADIYDI